MKDAAYQEVSREDPGAPADDGLEAALEEIGGNNRWMWLVFVLASAPGIFNIWALTSYVFLAAELEYWCDTPELQATNWTHAQIRNITAGDPDSKSCNVANFSSSFLQELSAMPFEQAEVEARRVKDDFGSRRCSHFSFVEQGTSIIEEWTLVCNRLVMLSNVQMVVALGKFAGALLFGFVADKWGRKCSFVISCIMYIVAGPIAGIFPIYWVFVVARFVLVTEVSNASRRTLLGILYNMSYPLGLLILPVIAYYVPQWRWLQLATSIPAVLLIINCWLIPESPRWLLSQGRRDDAWAIVKKANKELAKTRQTHLTPLGTDNAGPDTSDLSWVGKLKASMEKFTSLLLNCDLCMRLMICQYMWCVTALSYYALSLNADNFTADRYIYTAASGAVEAISYVIPIPILRYIGRRQTSAAMYLLSGAALLSILAIPKESGMAILAVAMVGRLCISAVYSVIILYTTELFPTVNRNTAVGISSTMSHGAVGRNIPSTICGLICLSAGLLVLLLPETKGRALCDTVEEMEENALKGDKVAIRNCCSMN
ncbi:Organic cation transporter protein [Gryllus bimaculatus]|nr:Organic cation transporter protein [Gryllus bimaculatus]